MIKTENKAWPKVIFGTSGLGNLYVAPPDETKTAIVEACLRSGGQVAVFDSAGKYGAGLALEALGKSLRRLGTDPEKIMISNKLGWYRIPLQTPEPTFEPGVWRDLQYDAVQKISYEGMMACYAQGNELLNGYEARLLSVHDPDEYLAAAGSEQEERYADILEAYRALADLKAAGKADAIGIGAKDWRIIQKISTGVKLDWVMIANSMTIHSHPSDLLRFMEMLKAQGVAIINSAVYNGGFLTGSDYYNYQAVNPVNHPDLYRWRDDFWRICREFGLSPAQASVSFALSAPGVTSIALSTSNPDRVAGNVAMAALDVPVEFWDELKKQGLLEEDYQYI